MLEAHICQAARAGADHALYRPPLVGISAADDPRYQALGQIIGPHHCLPEEILPGARSVISFFLPFSGMVVEANRGPGPVARLWAEAYIACNARVGEISQQLVRLLGAMGYAADTVRPTHTFDPVTLNTAWSHKSAARIAEMGRFGRHQLLITSAGCAGRFGSVITTAPLAPDTSPAPERCLHLAGGACRYCISACPQGALTEQGLDKQQCYRQLLATDVLYSDLDTCDVCGKCAVGPCAMGARA